MILVEGSYVKQMLILGSRNRHLAEQKAQDVHTAALYYISIKSPKNNVQYAII